jgi:Mrp family chromosome partitioning ATPase
MVAINDVKKELNFCVKTKTPIIGVVENMAMFVCPKCDVIYAWHKHATEIFNSLHGGASAMCKKYEQELLGSIPLEPAVGQLCEEGKSIVKEKPDSASAKRLCEITDSRLPVMI